MDTVTLSSVMETMDRLVRIDKCSTVDGESVVTDTFTCIVYNAVMSLNDAIRIDSLAGAHMSIAATIMNLVQGKDSIIGFEGGTTIHYTILPADSVLPPLDLSDFLSSTRPSNSMH